MEQQAFTIQVSDQTDTYGKVVIEPLSNGYGQTLGNSIRRVMLSYLRGAAVTSVQISGVQHQFSSLKGMREDIVEFVLNLKELNIKYSGEEPVALHLSASGKGEVTASQIEQSGNVEIINKDLVLGHLADKDSKLEATITVESGVGYSPADERESTTIGLIPVDAIYSPVKRVNYSVTNTRVGQVTNFDKLTMEVWTDGTITVEKAVKDAAAILRSYFDKIVNPEELPVEEETEDEVDTEQNEMLNLTVEELELPTRIANALRKAGYGTVRDIIEAPKNEIMKVKNLGGKSMTIIEEALRDKGVDFS